MGAEAGTLAAQATPVGAATLAALFTG